MVKKVNVFIDVFLKYCTGFFKVSIILLALIANETKNLQMT